MLARRAEALGWQQWCSAGGNEGHWTAPGDDHGRRYNFSEVARIVEIKRRPPSVKRLLGYFILSLPFMAATAYMVYAGGILLPALIWAGIGLVYLLGRLGLHLIDS